MAEKPKANQIPGIERRVGHNGRPVWFDRKSGVVYARDPNSEQLGGVIDEEVGRPGGQPERTRLMPPESTAPASGSPTEGTAQSKPTFADLPMPPGKAGSSKLKPLPKKKKVTEDQVSEYDNPYVDMFEDTSK